MTAQAEPPDLGAPLPLRPLPQRAPRKPRAPRQPAPLSPEQLAQIVEALRAPQAPPAIQARAVEPPEPSPPPVATAAPTAGPPASVAEALARYQNDPLAHRPGSPPPPPPQPTEDELLAMAQGDAPMPVMDRPISQMSTEELAAEMQRRAANVPQANLRPVTGRDEGPTRTYFDPSVEMARIATAPPPGVVHNLPPVLAPTPRIINDPEHGPSLARPDPMPTNKELLEGTRTLRPPVQGALETPQPDWIDVELPGGVMARVPRSAIQVVATPSAQNPETASHEPNYRCMHEGTMIPTGHPDFYVDPQIAAAGLVPRCPTCQGRALYPLY